MTRSGTASAAMLLFLVGPLCALGQQTPWNPADILDPARDLSSAPLESATHPPLPEQYIWAAADSAESASPAQTKPVYFRRTFSLESVPKSATLYIAAPAAMRAFVNGKLVEQVDPVMNSALVIHVYAQNVADALQTGKNVIAIQVLHGRPSGAYTHTRVTFFESNGELLIVKLLPAERGIDAPALVNSDGDWKGSRKAVQGWEGAEFDDSAWKPVESIGGIESSIDMLQWNADAGLYNWPGYDGISPFLAHLPLRAATAEHAYAGRGQFHNLEALSAKEPGGQEFSVDLPASQVEQQLAPQLLLDFGREVDGRVQFVSDSAQPADVTVQYGESEAEAQRDPYLGVNPLFIPPQGTAYGPKSAFRFALVRFVGGAPNVRFKSIQLDGIYYPVRYQGFFSSSDSQLNLMWAIGAYTAHLCMQDDIWDAPKRDRGRWMGDLDVSGRTIEDAFDDHFLMEDTLNRLMGSSPVQEHVNTIPGYSAFWITGEAEYYRHTGSKQQLAAFHDRLIQLMHYMEKDLDERNLFADRTKAWPFVDWSPEFEADTPETRKATQFEYYAAFRDGAYLLNELGDTTNAKIFLDRASQLKAAAQRSMLDVSTNSFGTRWQTNAAAVLFGVADPSQYPSIWKASLASVGKIKYNALIVTPYYNYYVISAMAKMGHRAQALDWIRQYWGGMVKEGATSFWEGYDPSWYKNNFHAALQADNASGYQTSLAHGWSSGVTPWLMEQVLGIHSTAAGFSKVDIRPDLIDLEWAKGGEPTPRGMLTVSIQKASAGLAVSLDVPSETEASVSMPVSHASSLVSINGKEVRGVLAENGVRAIVTLNHGGHFELKAGNKE